MSVHRAVRDRHSVTLDRRWSVGGVGWRGRGLAPVRRRIPRAGAAVEAAHGDVQQAASFLAAAVLAGGGQVPFADCRGRAHGWARDLTAISWTGSRGDRDWVYGTLNVRRGIAWAGGS